MTIARQVARGAQTASTQDAVLDLLARRPEGLTVTEVAEQLRLHVITARVHLDRLTAEERFLQHNERVGVGRPWRRYPPVPRAAPPAAIQDDYQPLTGILARVLDVENTRAEDVLKGWVMCTLDAGILGLPEPSEASWQDKVDVVFESLGSWGYDPWVTRTGPCYVAAEPCGYPFSKTAFSCPKTVCGVHRGFTCGALGALGEANTDVELEADLSGESCCLGLSREVGHEGEK